MKTTVRAAVVLAAAVVCGCGTLRTERLKAGMTQDEVTALYGQPKAIYHEKVGNSFVQALDYSRESIGIANYLDDYGWIKVPTTHVVRAWFVDGHLTDWCGGRYSSYEALKKLEMRCELRVPPSFDSAGTPETVRKLKGR